MDYPDSISIAQKANQMDNPDSSYIIKKLNELIKD